MPRADARAPRVACPESLSGRARTARRLPAAPMRGSPTANGLTPSMPSARRESAWKILEGMTVTLPPTGLAANRIVLKIDRVTVGYQPERPVLRDFSLTICGRERVAVIGRNGSGKTTLLALIAGTLPPWSGTVLTGASFAMLDQRATLLDPERSIRDNFVRINRQWTKTPAAPGRANESSRHRDDRGRAARVRRRLAGGQPRSSFPPGDRDGAMHRPLMFVRPATSAEDYQLSTPVLDGSHPPGLPAHPRQFEAKPGGLAPDLPEQPPFSAYIGGRVTASFQTYGLNTLYPAIVVSA